MRTKTQTVRLITAICLLFLLIINADVSAAGAKEGVTLCIQVIIPSLFPFFLITSYLNPLLLGMKVPGLAPLTKCLGIPNGCEGLLLLGLVGGYPVGAQAVSNAYQMGKLEQRNAHILMGYCSNAGPAFIFGVTGILFPTPAAPWILWGIHILSAIITGLILPKCSSSYHIQADSTSITFLQAFHKSLLITASVCGWVIAFKVVLALIFLILPSQIDPLNMYITGILELSGGCIALSSIDNLSLRFVVCSALLAFGGLCVVLQTASVCGDCGLGLYIPGKLMQTILSILISLPLVFIHNRTLPDTATLLLIIIVGILNILLLRWYCRKKLWKLSHS